MKKLRHSRGRCLMQKLNKCLIHLYSKSKYPVSVQASHFPSRFLTLHAERKQAMDGSSA